MTFHAPVHFSPESRKILDSNDLLDSVGQCGTQNLGSKALISKIFRLKDLAAAHSAGLGYRVGRFALGA